MRCSKLRTMSSAISSSARAMDGSTLHAQNAQNMPKTCIQVRDLIKGLRCSRQGHENGAESYIRVSMTMALRHMHIGLLGSICSAGFNQTTGAPMGQLSRKHKRAPANRAQHTAGHGASHSSVHSTTSNSTAWGNSLVLCIIHHVSLHVLQLHSQLTPLTILAL